MLTGNMLYVSSSSLYRNGKGYLNDTVHFSKKTSKYFKISYDNTVCITGRQEGKMMGKI